MARLVFVQVYLCCHDVAQCLLLIIKSAHDRYTADNGGDYLWYKDDYNDDDDDEAAVGLSQRH